MAITVADLNVRFSANTSAAERGIDNVERKLDGARGGAGRFSAALSGIGTAAVAGLALAGTAVVGFLGASVGVAASFESQMNILTVAARSSGTAMEDLSAAALQVGGDSELVGISASEAADAMTNFYKAGLTTSEIFSDLNGYLDGTTGLTGALRAAVDLAAASELDLAAASDVVAVAMATFGLGAEDAASIANTLVGAADASLASVSGLSDGLKNVGPAAAAMGMSLEDTTTALALLSTRGIQGAEAGTALKSMLLNLQRPTADVTDTLAALGVSLYDSAGTMRALPDVIAALESAMAGMTDEQRQATAVTLAGSYGLNAFNVLLGEGAAGWDAMTTSIGAAATAQEVAAARTQGFQAAVEQVKGALETFMISVGMPLIQNFLTPAAAAMAKVIAELTKMAPSVEEVQAGYERLVAQGTALVTSITAVVGPIAEAIGQFVEWQDVLAALGVVVAALVIPALASIVTAAAPIVLAFAGLVAAVALLRTAWEQDWGGIQGKTQAVIDGLQPALEKLKVYLEMIKGGDWGGLVNAVFADVGAMLSSASATIAAFDWADWIDGALDWAAYIGQLAWDGFLTLLDWQVFIWKLEWSAFVTALDWAAYALKLGWSDFVSALDWQLYILELKWPTYVKVMEDWGKWVSTIDWAEYVTALSDWATYVKGLAWDTFVSALTWGADYIQSLDWDKFIETIADWGEWISSLDWEKIIATTIDWATWIPALTWNTFVKLLDWATIVVGFVWTEWISKLSWADFVAALSWGGDKVSKLDWADFVAVFTWVGKVAAFAWDAFVSKLEWPLIAEFDWASWIANFQWPTLPVFYWRHWIFRFTWPSLPSFSWSSWISGFNWPSLPSFSWSSWISGFNWPSLPSFSWSNWIPAFSWPTIPAFPGWSALLDLLGIDSQGGVLGIDSQGESSGSFGTSSGGQLALALPAVGGLAAGGGGSGGITVNLYATVANGLDVEEMAWRVAQTIQRRQR